MGSSSPARVSSVREPAGRGQTEGRTACAYSTGAGQGVLGCLKRMGHSAGKPALAAGQQGNGGPQGKKRSGLVAPQPAKRGVFGKRSRRIEPSGAQNCIGAARRRKPTCTS